VKPLTLIPKLKSKLKKGTSIIGFLSHVQGDLKQKAHEVGCDMVLPRSAFSQNLPQYSKGPCETVARRFPAEFKILPGSSARFDTACSPCHQ
jgi:hypothetical protein